MLITGCSTGIGHETALHLTRNGWSVIATARRPETLADLAGTGCETLALDVTDEASMEAAVSAVTATGPLYGLVNNAGYSPSGAIESVELNSVRRQFETNVFGLIRMSQLVLPGMREAGAGRLVNISSMGGRLTFPGGGIYHATKYAIEAISDALRFEVRGVRHPRRLHRARPDPHGVRHRRGGLDRRRHRRRPLRRVQRPRRRRDGRRLRGRSPGKAGRGA